MVIPVLKTILMKDDPIPGYSRGRFDSARVPRSTLMAGMILILLYVRNNREGDDRKSRIKES